MKTQKNEQKKEVPVEAKQKLSKIGLAMLKYSGTGRIVDMRAVMK